MTLSALRSELAAIHAHDLTPVNVEAVEAMPGAVFLDIVDRDAETIAGLKEELADTETALKAAEDEAAEWERQLEALENDRDGEDIADVRQSLRVFRAACSNWATRCQTLQAEVTALRKRKGVAAGVCAYSHEVVTLLGYLSMSPDNRYAEDARKLLDKLHSL